jgi:hypothetical protein
MRASAIGSGTVAGLGMAGLATTLLWLIQVVGWDPTWRAMGVTPLHPPFFDMHVINDYAACAWKGLDPYAPHACNVDNFNIPPTWLSLGKLGLDGTDSAWLSLVIIAAAGLVMALLYRGRSWPHGLILLVAVASPSVMMGIERGNLDLLILAIVGTAALLYGDGRPRQASGAFALLALGVLLKLIPMFCVVLAARSSRKTFVFALVLAAFSFAYLFFDLEHIFLIRRNVPTTFVLSYGYKAIFLGIDHVRSEAGLPPIGLADMWLPALSIAVTLVCAAGVAINSFFRGREFCSVDHSVAGTAFLFGAGIYCGTYMLGTNFIYRLMFVLLCLPQLQDWQIQRRNTDRAGDVVELVLFATILATLWLNGGPNGHSIFLWFPQMLDWFLFFFLSAVMMLNFLRTSWK